MRPAAFKRTLTHLRRPLLVAILVIVLAVPPFVNLFLQSAHAATPSPIKLLINNSQAGATGVTYTLQYTASVNTAIQRLTIQFCDAASGACSTPAGMVTTGATRVGTNINGTSPSDTFGGNGTLRTDWTAVTQNPLTVSYVVSGVTNPTTPNTTSYARVTSYSDAGSTVIDSTTVAFAVLDTTSIAVSASIDPNFTFAIAGVASSGTVNSSTTTVTTTATAIPFGTLTAGTPAIGAQDVTVTTNASNGYTVTASHSATAQTGFPPLVSGSTNNIDSFTGSNASPAVWSAPNGSTANTNTGFFGYTTEDTSLCTGTAGRFGSNKWAGSTTTGQELVCSAGGINSETTRVGWQVEVNTVQPAGSYTGTVILVATPTY